MMMINYRQLEQGYKRMMDGERNCMELVSFLTKNNTKRIGGYDDECERRYIKVDESLVQSCNVIILSSTTTVTATSSKQHSNLITDYIPNESYQQQESRNTSNRLIQQQQHRLMMDQQSSNQIDDEYFEMEIVMNGEIGNESHQVKMFHSKGYICPSIESKGTISSNQCFNLSNFSSFNNQNHNYNQFPNHSNLQQQNLFYQQQLQYLIKKIQFIYGRKLSIKGVTKIINSLQLMVGEGFNSNNSCELYSSNYLNSNKNRYDNDGGMLKDITINLENDATNRAKSKLNKPIKPPPSNKKIQFSTQLQSQPKSKQKGNNKIYSSKNQTNKENQNFPFVQKGNKGHKTQKQQKKGKQRSVSPLSYRVLMQKKKLMQKPQKPSLNQEQIHEPYSGQSLPQSYQSSSIKSFSSRPQCLKIILQKIHQNLSKTLSFQCHLDANKPFEIKKQVQRYCEQNSINKTNVNIIMDALSQRKPIITIKSKGIQ